jgi:hypothetical protein
MASVKCALERDSVLSKGEELVRNISGHFGGRAAAE